MSEKGKPILTDAKGMGGVVAQDGFDYQLWESLVRLPTWLASPAFEAFMLEGLEDIEARFFAPHAPRQQLLERYQAKSGDLSPAAVKTVFESFHEFELAYPYVTRVHVLVTPRLPSTLSWLTRDQARVRSARPFYAPFPGILKASDDGVRSRLVDHFGELLGGFVAESVEVEERVLPDRSTARNAFWEALTRSFPHLDVGIRSIDKCFDSLSIFVSHSRGTTLMSKDLTALIESALSCSLFTRKLFPVHVRSDRNNTDDQALEIDASTFSGGDSGFPDVQAWAAELEEPLSRTARWLLSRNERHILLTGSYRLSTGFLVGWSFRAATGFDLKFQTRDGFWATDEHPRGDKAYPPWAVHDNVRLEDGRLVVSVGICRRPANILVSTCGIAQDTILDVFLGEPMAAADGVQAGVASVKRAISRAVEKWSPQQVDLYYAGPAVFAVALGHRWNAMPVTQLYEFISLEQRYVATARVGRRES